MLDRGPGLAEHETERVFEPFYRSENAPFRSGVGIGLSVCKRVIEASHGRTWIAARPGGGTIAAFALPVLQPNELL